jgi:hypothetical protein
MRRRLIKMSETRVDPTVAGLFLVGFITLFFGLLGIELFQDGTSKLAGVAADFICIIGIIMVVFAFMAGKSGNAFATALFAFVAVALFGVTYGLPDFPVVFYAIALFFVVFAITGFLVDAPKLLVVLLFLVALLYFFVGLWFGYDEAPYAAAFGLFGILSFLVATYLAIGLGTQKLPVF